MDHISSLLPKVLQKKGLTSHCEASLIIHHAEAWISSNLHVFQADLRPKKFADGVLVIDCSNSVAAQECHQRAQELLTFLRESVGSDAVSDIRVSRDEHDRNL